MLRERRRELHRAIAEAIEAASAARPTEQYERLAHHYTEAGLTEQAVGYCQLAGQRAIERSANSEGVAHLTKGLELLASLPDTPDRSRQELTLQLGVGVGLQSLEGAGSPEVGRAYTRARELCQQVGEAADHCAALWGLWRFQRTKVEFQTARELAEVLSNMAQGQHDSALILQAHHAQWTTEFYFGEFTACQDYTERGIALYDARKHHAQTFRFGGHDPCVCGHTICAFSLWLLGYPDQAVAHLDSALALAHELHHPASLALALEQAAYLHQLRREERVVRERGEASLELAREHGFAENFATATFVAGWAAAEIGRIEEGIADMRLGLVSRRALGRKVEEPHVLAYLVEMLAKVAQPEEGMKVLAEAFAAADDRGMIYWNAELHRLKGLLLLSRPQENDSDAEACFRKAIEIARGQGAKSFELRAATSLARLWKGRGRNAEARDLLTPAYGWFTEGFDTADLKDAKALLDDLT